MHEYHLLCIERAYELAAKPYKLTPRQIAERTGLSVNHCRNIIREVRGASTR